MELGNLHSGKPTMRNGVPLTYNSHVLNLSLLDAWRHPMNSSARLRQNFKACLMGAITREEHGINFKVGLQKNHILYHFSLASTKWNKILQTEPQNVQLRNIGNISCLIRSKQATPHDPPFQLDLPTAAKSMGEQVNSKTVPRRTMSNLGRSESLKQILANVWLVTSCIYRDMMMS